MTNTVRTIVLHSQEIKKDKQSFIASSAEINGRWFKVKFTKECDGQPKTKGLYELTIDFDECSIENGKIYTRADGTTGIANDTIWVRTIAGLRKFTEEELKEANRESMKALFGDSE